jgi:hypothetical protein
MIASQQVQERPGQMSDGITLCGRCGKPLSDEALVFALAQAVSESVPRELRLCARCTESFERWYWKRAKSTAGSAASIQAANAAAAGFASVSKGARHQGRKKPKRNRLIRILTITTLTILLFLAVFYSTWTILKTATRTGE